MKIESVSVNGLFGEFDYNLELNEGLTFLHSPNGNGKSTLMHMMYSLLKGDTEYLGMVPFSEFGIRFTDGEVLKVMKGGPVMSFSIEKGSDRNEVSDESLPKISGISYIPPDRLIVDAGNGYYVDALESIVRSLKERFNQLNACISPVSPDDVEDVTDDSLEDLFRYTLKMLSTVRQAGISPSFPDGMQFPPTSGTISKDRRGYFGLYRGLTAYINKAYPFARSVLALKQVVNEVFLNKSVFISDDGELTVSMDNGTPLDLSKLSSGEKHIIIMFYRILFESHRGGTVLLDEPEISLHVSWQQRLGDFFETVCDIGDIQMVVATHSPQVIHDRWDCARELRSGDARVPDGERRRQQRVDEPQRLRWHRPAHRRHHGPEAVQQVHR